MGIKNVFRRTKLGGFGEAIHNTPREVLTNKYLLLTSLLFACGAVPLSTYYLSPKTECGR